MQAEVDQSGKVETTIQPTVLALANGVQFTIRISAGEKRKLFDESQRRRPKWTKRSITVTIFSILVFFVVKDHMREDTYIAIDTEYEGNERFIKDRLMTLCRKHGIHVHSDQIQFRQPMKLRLTHCGEG